MMACALNAFVVSFFSAVSEEGGGSGILSISWIMPVISLLVIITWFLLDRFYFRPVEEVQKERFHLTEGRIEEARKVQIEAENLSKTYDQRIHETRLKCQDIIAERRRRVEEETRTMLERAREESRSMVQKTKMDLARQVEEKKQDLQSYAQTLAKEIAERILARPVLISSDTPSQERRYDG